MHIGYHAFISQGVPKARTKRIKVHYENSQLKRSRKLCLLGWRHGHGNRGTLQNPNFSH